MSDDTAIFVGASDADQFLLLKYANRHGLIAGATGTGKTVTLQTIAEGFSAYGVPVFMADVKGDLSGVSQPGSDCSIPDSTTASPSTIRPASVRAPASSIRPVKNRNVTFGPASSLSATCGTGTPPSRSPLLMATMR